MYSAPASQIGPKRDLCVCLEMVFSLETFQIKSLTRGGCFSVGRESYSAHVQEYFHCHDFVQRLKTWPEARTVFC